MMFYCKKINNCVEDFYCETVCKKCNSDYQLDLFGNIIPKRPESIISERKRELSNPDKYYYKNTEQRADTNRQTNTDINRQTRTEAKLW